MAEAMAAAARRVGGMGRTIEAVFQFEFLLPIHPGGLVVRMTEPPLPTPFQTFEVTRYPCQGLCPWTPIKAALIIQFFSWLRQQPRR